MNKKRIIIVGSAYPLRGGGISTFNERLSRALNDAGHDSIIYNFSLQYPRIFFPGKNQYTNEPGPDGLDIRIRINSINPINWIIVGNEIRKLKPDLVIFRFWIPFMAPCFGTIARQVRKDKDILVIAIADNIVPHDPKPGDNLFIRYFVKRMQGFITMSKTVEDSLQLFDTGKPRLLTPHPLYDNFGSAIPKRIAREKLGLIQEQKYLLFFGFIREYKGLDILLEAMAEKPVRQAQFKLLVVGEFYVNPQPYLDFINKHELSQNVILFNRYIPNNEVPLFFSACDLVVQPYKSATQSGVSQVAMYFGKPIITTNVGGLADMIADGVVGKVVRPDSGKLAQAILETLDNNLLEEYERNMAKEKLKFSWDNMLETIEKLYHKIKNG